MGKPEQKPGRNRVVLHISCISVHICIGVVIGLLAKLSCLNENRSSPTFTHDEPDPERGEGAHVHG